jgi:hypothetical protein
MQRNCVEGDRCKQKNNIEMGLVCNRVRTGFIGLGLGPVRTREHDNKPSGSVTCWLLLYWPGNC